MPQGPLAAVVAQNPALALVPLKVDINGALIVVTESGPEPEPTTPVNASSGNVANAVAAATMPAVAGKTNYVEGFDLSASGATAGSAVTATLTGVVGGPLSYTFVFPAGVAVAAQPLSRTFNPPLAASAPNTAIVISLPAGGSGNTNSTSNINGFVQ